MLLVLTREELFCVPSDSRPGQPGAITRLRSFAFLSPGHLVSGVTHVALVSSPGHVQLFTMHPGPALQLMAEVHIAAAANSKDRATSLCMSPAGRYLAVIALEVLHVVSTCSGKTLAVYALDRKRRRCEVSDPVRVNDDCPFWHDGAHRPGAHGISRSSKEFTGGNVQLDVWFAEG